jgi:hypothetical protein
MSITHRSVNHLAQPSDARRRWRHRIAVAFTVVLATTLLGGTLALSGHHMGGAGRWGEVAHSPAHEPPASPQTSSPYTFVGTVPDSRIDERAISPMETVGAAAN